MSYCMAHLTWTIFHFQNAFLYVSISTLYLLSSSLIIHLSHYYNENYAWIPESTIHRLIIAGVSVWLWFCFCFLQTFTIQAEMTIFRGKGERFSSSLAKEKSSGWAQHHIISCNFGGRSSGKKCFPSGRNL